MSLPLARIRGQAHRARACVTAATGPRQQRVCLVQGASRGLGFALTKLLVERGDIVFATCRNPDGAKQLQILQESKPLALSIVQLDAVDPESVANAAAKVSQHPLAARNGKTVLDLLINTAGVLQDTTRGLVPERGLARISSQNVLSSFAVNALGPLLVMQSFVPLLRRAAAQNSDAREADRPAASAVFYSARVGSIGDNQLGGWYSYRGSKACLNQFVRCMSAELSKHRVCCLAFHPGTVDTELTRAFAQARAKYTVQDVDSAAANHLEIFESLSMRDTGRFLDWRRDEVPW